jgi:hypothetical protein
MMHGNPEWCAIMDVVVWLRSLGLGKYEATFRDNDIDETVLPSLTQPQRAWRHVADSVMDPVGK